MKRSILLIVAVLFFMSEEIFAGSIVTQRVVRACGFVKGSTTLNLSGQMNDAAMQSIADGNGLAIYNSLDSYLVFPTLFPRTKTGFGVKTATQNVSIKTKNGKFKWTEKDVTPYFSFATTNEIIRPSKAVFKSKGTLQTSELAELENKKLTVFDKLCAEQGLGYLASLAFTPEIKGKNYKFSYSGNKIQAKGSINPKGKITAKYALPFEVAYPAFLESESIFTNKYDYSLVIVGDGEVYSGYCGPDQVEFKVTKNNKKFRYFAYNGIKETNEFMKLDLEADTEVQAVFGTYDLSLEIIGKGLAIAEFTGPDEVEVKVTENKDKFRYFTVNGERCTDSEMTLVLEEDTVVEAVFGNYDLNVTISGKGSVNRKFVGPDEVIVTAISGGEFFESFEWDANVSNENPLKLTMTKDTELLATFKISEHKYIVIDISGGPNADFYPIECLSSMPQGGWTEEYKTTKLVLRKIEPKTFYMGSPIDERGRKWRDEMRHQVMLTNAYYIGVFETTQKQYELIMGCNPSRFKGDARPVEFVSYDMLRGADKGAAWPASYDVDNDSFFGILRAKTQMTFDLPTEAQWEYACRASTTTALNSGYDLSRVDRQTGRVLKDEYMDRVGRYYYNGGSNENHTVVGSYVQNSWGLFDMHGNVCEWCLDWFQEVLEPAAEPIGALDGQRRVLRSGSCYSAADECRSASRSYESSSYASSISGFRVVLVLVPNVVSGPKIQNDFEFEIESETENTLPIFQTKFYGKLKDGTEKLLEEMGKLEYDGASGIVAGTGKHKLTWIPDEAYTNIMDEVELRVEYEDVTEQATYLVLNTTSNKMRVSPEGPDITDNKCRTDELWLRRIEPGCISMGDVRGGAVARHVVALTKAYYIGVFEATQKQCENIMGVNPSLYKGDLRPAEYISYDMIRGAKNGSAWPKNNGVDEWSFMGQLRKKAGNIFDLPTEAQWEYACRAGSITDLNSRKDLSNSGQCEEMDEVGRYYYNGINHATVGSYLPNAWGLYDMHGNVSEWCLDWYGLYEENEYTTDPKGQENGETRSIRGGSWDSTAYNCRSAYRGYSLPDKANSCYGFRVVLVHE